MLQSIALFALSFHGQRPSLRLKSVRVRRGVRCNYTRQAPIFFSFCGEKRTFFRSIAVLCPQHLLWFASVVLLSPPIKVEFRLASDKRAFIWARFESALWACAMASSKKDTRNSRLAFPGDFFVRRRRMLASGAGLEVTPRRGSPVLSLRPRALCSFAPVEKDSPAGFCLIGIGFCLFRRFYAAHSTAGQKYTSYVVREQAFFFLANHDWQFRKTTQTFPGSSRAAAAKVLQDCHLTTGTWHARRAGSWEVFFWSSRNVCKLIDENDFVDFKENVHWGIDKMRNFTHKFVRSQNERFWDF